MLGSVDRALAVDRFHGFRRFGGFRCYRVMDSGDLFFLLDNYVKAELTSRLFREEKDLLRVLGSKKALMKASFFVYWPA